jgi:hypothetical protein
MPDSEGPWTKAGVIIGATSGLLGLIIAYIGVALAAHWVPFAQAVPAPSSLVTTSPSTTTSPTIPGGHETESPSPAINPSGSPAPLAAMYYGVITYSNGGYTSNLQLCRLTDADGQLSGDLVIWNGPGSGSFSGSTDGTSHISFSVSHPFGEYGVMDFTGSISKNGTMIGTFTITNPHQQGNWNAHSSPAFQSSQC